VSLATPESIRKLQRGLYAKAKAEPRFRFYLLYDKVYREDILFHAYRLARSNGGSAGVDGVRFSEIESSGLEGWLEGLGKELREQTYRASPVRRVMIPKPGGGERPLGIPTIRDRVVQTAAKLLRLIKAWLKAPVEETDQHGNRRMRGGRRSKTGTPQGGVISPLLANIYMNRFLRVFHERGKDREHRARLVSYADDFVILSRGCAESALAWTRGVLGAIGLTLDETKTCIRDARRETFDFLGYSFGPDISRKTGRRHLSTRPSKKSMQQVRRKIRERLHRNITAPWREVEVDLNRLLRGWAGYFSYGTRWPAYRAIDRHVYDRARHFLRRRHKVSTRGTRRFSYETLYGELGIVKLTALIMSERAVGVA